MIVQPLSLWLAYPDDLVDDSLAQACRVLLSEGEHRRWQSFRPLRRRREFLANRALVRTSLSHFQPLAPADWRFQVNAYGKPATDPDCGLRFNLSDSHGLAACLIAQGTEVGVDIEPYERGREIIEIAGEVFSPAEIAQLKALARDEQNDRALSLWTLKEAYIKARGMGLSLPLKKFSFLFGATQGIRLQLDADFTEAPGRNWRFSLLDLAGHRVALMTERTTEATLQIWEARPLLSPATQLPAAKVQWFPAA